MVRLSPDRMTVPEGLAWLDAALDFFEQVSRPDAPAQLQAAGGVAYALHNFPEVLAKRLVGETVVLCVFGPPYGRESPPDVKAHYDTFFARRPGPLKTTRPLTAGDPIWKALRDTIMAFRPWRRGFPDQPSLAERFAGGAEEIEQARQESRQIATAMRRHFRRWLDGDDFSPDAFVQDGGWMS